LAILELLVKIKLDPTIDKDFQQRHCTAEVADCFERKPGSEA